MLIAGVGYRNLRDLSVGPVMVERLRQHMWPEGVEVEDFSYGAVAALHWFRERPPLDAAIFITAVERGLAPGTVSRVDWFRRPISPDEVQTRVAEAVTGVISLDATLTVLAHFDALPKRTVAYEVEPRDLDWGLSFSPPVQDALLQLETLVRRDVVELAAT